MQVSQASSSRVRLDGKFFRRREQRLRIQGVTYGPFAPDAQGDQFPARSRVDRDFALMREIGVNSIRTYHVPPQWFLEAADEADMLVLVDVPWPKHICFLDSREAQREARERVRQAAERSYNHPSVFALSIGNEIPSDIVRWHGAGRVEGFLAELMDVARQANPDALITYANYPSTEYLDLSFLDFGTFNVYLHDPEPFRRYLFRLQNIVGDKPLLLGEIGMDTFSHNESEQASFLRGHLRDATLLGVAGAFVFAWTDDWFTGGFQIEDWAFGITKADRSPKPSFAAVAAIYQQSPAALLSEALPYETPPGEEPPCETLSGELPRVSVVVCSYNGASTLEQCLRSLQALDYPDFEIILVDDGSTDNTPEISARFPQVHTIRQSNHGLSAARNVGLRAATGSIVAYTDSDCYADPDWLTRLVYQLQHSGADAVGGPNLTPDDGALAACVAVSPGQPTHVLDGDQVAEHIPGCNMAFYRESLLAINGFNERYRKAGDDVDACWRLQQNGGWITFAPGAFVWHHRRQNPSAFMRQQAGYGEAEGLLWFDHPDRFNRRGESRWRGMLYGESVQGLRFGAPFIYHGTFGTGLFQTVYQPALAHWATLPSTLEWHLAAALIGMVGFVWAPFWGIAACMLVLSFGVAALQAIQAPLPTRYRGLKSLLLVATLCYRQPLVRSWARYQTRFFPPRAPDYNQEFGHRVVRPIPLTGSLIIEYWDEQWRERTELLSRIVAYTTGHRWAALVDSGWDEWDIMVIPHPWTTVTLTTAQEDHGSGKRLIRLRYTLHTTRYTKALVLVAALAALIALEWQAVPALMISVVLLLFFMAVWVRGTALAGEVAETVDQLAMEMGLMPCNTSPSQEDERVTVRSTDTAALLARSDEPDPAG